MQGSCRAPHHKCLPGRSPTRSLGGDCATKQGRRQLWQRAEATPCAAVRPRCVGRSSCSRRCKRHSGRLLRSLANVSVSAAGGETRAPTLWACRACGKGGGGRALLWWGVDHQHEALLGGRELRDVMLRVGAANVLLHGAVPLLLCSKSCYSRTGCAVAELVMTCMLRSSKRLEEDSPQCSAFDMPSCHGCAAGTRRRCSRLRRRRIQ